MARAKKSKEEVQDETIVDETVEEEVAQEEEVAEELPAPKGLSVHARLQQGFIRCGRRFAQEPTIFQPGELSEAEIKVLRAEKMLVVKDL